MVSETRQCKRCLTREMIGQEEYFRNLRETIEHIEPEHRADAILYEQRLSACRECDMLLQGMCRVCGCYVELRAALAAKSCPNHRW